MNILIYILKRLRIIFKSLGKNEHKINNFLKFLFWKKRNDIDKLNYNDEVNNQPLDSDKVKNMLPKKLAICVTFFYNEKKISILKNTCSEFNNLAQEVDVTIITNENSDEKLENLKSSLENVLKSFSIHVAQNLQHPKFLPWSHLVVMRSKVSDNSFTHFMYLEDDIKVSPKNIIYWINARNALKTFNLIPSFIRTEINFMDNETYVVDSTKKNNFKKTPRVYSLKNDMAFVNLLFPHQPLYFFDKELMNEYFNGPPSDPDFAIPAAKDHYQGIVERLDLMLTYHNVPEGFFHRAVVPVDIRKKAIKNYCLVEHLSNKYTNQDSNFGVIKVKDLFF